MRPDSATHGFDAADDDAAEDQCMRMWRVRNEARAALVALQAIVG